MERSDERLSTRDIAAPSTTEDDTRFDRDDAIAERPTAEPTRDTMADPTVGTGDTATAEPVDARPATADSATTAEAAAAEPDAPVAADAGRATTTDGARTTSGSSDDTAPLLPDSGDFQTRWEDIQVRFVDEPRGAVEDADALVATVMQKLAESFAQERERLEAQWGRGEDISTEDLRVALQRYRSFFQRLLAT